MFPVPDAKAAILGLRREVAFEFREVDIGWSGDLYEDYKHDIPWWRSTASAPSSTGSTPRR